MGKLSLIDDTYEGRPAVRLDMGSSLDMQAAEALCEVLREAVCASQPLIIDAASVERMSTSAIQLLLAAERALAGIGCPMAVRDPTGAFLAAFADLGFEPDAMNWVLVENTDG